MHNGPKSTSLRARWVFPVDAEPLENGTVEIEDGRITAVHASRDPRAVDLGNAAVIPGLVNAHTHLEFSDFDEPVAPASGGFTDWIRAVVGHRRERNTGPAETIQSGLAECAQSGTTLLGEIATEGWSPDNFSSASPGAVVFRELIGPLPEQRTEQLEIARRHLQVSESEVRSPERKIGDRDFPALRSPLSALDSLRGLSPHAPYSMHPDLFRDLVGLAEEHDAPLAMHLAETRAELELLEHGTGEFAEMLREFGVWRDEAIPRGNRPLDYLEPLSRLRHALVVHGNYLADDEIDLLARHPNLSLVYCPRTHAFFGHAEHPWRELLRRGGNVALGTDSRASNPDLSLWNELTFLRKRSPEIPPRTLLELGTIHGARALGLDAGTGSLTPGKAADLAVVQFDANGSGDPHELLFDCSRRVSGTMRAGIWIGGHSGTGGR